MLSSAYLMTTTSPCAHSWRQTGPAGNSPRGRDGQGTSESPLPLHSPCAGADRPRRARRRGARNAAKFGTREGSAQLVEICGLEKLDGFGRIVERIQSQSDHDVHNSPPLRQITLGHGTGCSAAQFAPAPRAVVSLIELFRETYDRAIIKLNLVGLVERNPIQQSRIPLAELPAHASVGAAYCECVEHLIGY